MNLENICQEVIATAKSAGAFIAGERVHFNAATIEKKGKANFVSYVDKMAEEMIVADLRKILPEAGFITEEGTATDSGERFRWVIDPLDGTTNFIHGTPPYAVSIGLIDHQEIILGVVYEIFRGECFYAWKGSPAFVDGKVIHVSDAATSEESLIITGFPYGDLQYVDEFTTAIRYFMGNSHGIRRFGSAATDLSYVAAGRAEAFWELGLHAWDVAAGALILQQAGGKVSDFKGSDQFLFSGEIVAATGKYFTEFQRLIAEFYSKKQ
ncbi:MAG: inositol monophosphatase [Marinilabiliales bacterium]|nr:inositol monophosphatase [Marinilabiliales bacterium]